MSFVKVNCIVLLDGLDEVGATEKVVQSILAFMEEFPLNRFVVTSRVIGSQEVPWKARGFSVLQIEEWKGEDLEQFCVSWCAALHEHDPKKECDECSRKAETFGDRSGQIRG